MKRNNHYAKIEINNPFDEGIHELELFFVPESTKHSTSDIISLVSSNRFSIGVEK